MPRSILTRYVEVLIQIIILTYKCNFTSKIKGAFIDSVYFNLGSVQPPVFGPPFKLVSGDAFSAPSAVLPKVQEVDNSELNVV